MLKSKVTDFVTSNQNNKSSFTSCTNPIIHLFYPQISAKALFSTFEIANNGYAKVLGDNRGILWDCASSEYNEYCYLENYLHDIVLPLLFANTFENSARNSVYSSIRRQFQNASTRRRDWTSRNSVQFSKLDMKSGNTKDIGTSNKHQERFKLRDIHASDECLEVI